jgi:catechol 2,3-dioxygenase-like lactoylglutathione lyase family enzyme
VGSRVGTTPVPSIPQIALCTTNIPASVSFFSSVFGFADAGGTVASGELVARLHELEGETACIAWWMVGRQDFVQLELIHHTNPTQRPLPESWKPSDLGWCRWGVAVPDFDDTLTRVGLAGLALMGPVMEIDGLRRACIRDPYVGTVIEIMEEGATLPGGIRSSFFNLAPAIVYVTLVVADLIAARRFFIETVGLREESIVLHTPAMEALWGTGGALRKVTVVGGGDMFVELVEYADESHNPDMDDRRLSDQGFMNIAIGYRQRGLLDELYERIEAAGYPTRGAPMDHPSWSTTYVRDDQNNSVEVLAIDREFDRLLGFEPTQGMMHAPAWPSTGLAPIRADRVASGSDGA